MARDMRHGYGKSHRPDFKRKSQQQEVVETEGSPSLIWLAVVFVSLALLGSFFAVKHFATQGVGSRLEALEILEEQPVDIAATDTITKAKIVEIHPPESEVSKDSKIDLKVVEQAEVPLNEANLAEKKQSLDSIQFTFYEGLSETEVVVYAEPIPVVLPEPYYILAGTFGRYELARQEQDRLKSRGLLVEISVLKLQRTYYRLRSGPFTNRIKMNKKRNELRRLGIDTLLIKVVSSKPKEN